MKVNGQNYRTVWMEGHVVFMIDQNQLPFHFKIICCEDYHETCQAIRNMTVRGAGALGAAAGFAMAQAFLHAPNEDYHEYITAAKLQIESTRPTARNLFYAVEKVYNAGIIDLNSVVFAAQEVAEKDAADSRAIGDAGNELIKDGYRILTHCNAGWLAFVDYGTALSPIYKAFEQGKDLFVYVDETRPRSQGSRLTAWELKQAGIHHAIIPDNAAAFLMSRGKVDLVITGADRIARNGDTANKIGTLEKAIAAKEFNIPFYIAAPSTTFDLDCSDGEHIVIEVRDEKEVLWQSGPDVNGVFHEIQVASPGSPAINYAFDVTPAHYIKGYITEKGIIGHHEISSRITK